MFWKKLLKLHNVATKCSYGYTKCSYGHTKLETPVPVRTLKLGDLGHGQGLEVDAVDTNIVKSQERRNGAPPPLHASGAKKKEMWWRIGSAPDF